ncbi:hypothetical protein MAR_006720 [Mya arenaria]|uniref:Uncharacterized protein n=1 Tax=Mya arenaria TaxID=6604 RepID=A0ABY7DCZ2_MYAAR|nr:hypothetical protein MAR_006720 [Mya arenaria]
MCIYFTAETSPSSLVLHHAAKTATCTSLAVELCQFTSNKMSPAMSQGAAMIPKSTTPTAAKVTRVSKIPSTCNLKRLLKCQSELYEQILHQQKLTIDSLLYYDLFHN